MCPAGGTVNLGPQGGCGSEGRGMEVGGWGWQSMGMLGSEAWRGEGSEGPGAPKGQGQKGVGDPRAAAGEVPMVTELTMGRVSGKQGSGRPSCEGKYGTGGVDRSH